MAFINGIKNIYHILNNYTFEVFFIGAICIILIVAIYRFFTGQKGSWSNQYFIPDNINNNKKKLRYDNDDTSLSSSLSSLPKKSFDSKGEVECRRVLQKIFKKPFEKIRPNFLNNPVSGNYNLELDCYDEEYKIAVEYNGVQHYKYCPYFHKNKEAFMNQKYRDEMKIRLCKDNGIFLITVPYTVQIDQIESFLINELNKKVNT